MGRIVKFRVLGSDGNWYFYTLGDFVCLTPMPEHLNPDSWSEFTGLTDKNGVEIYEGDIVDDGSGNQSNHVFSGVHKVEFKDGGFYPFSVSGWEGAFSVTNGAADCLVIGNINQHAELLK